SPLEICGPLMDAMEETLTSAAIEIAHLKIFDRAGSGWIAASICSNGQTPVPAGDLLAEAAARHELAINLRAVAEPTDLRRVVESCLLNVPGVVHVRHLAAFRPTQSTLEYRISLESASGLLISLPLDD